MARGTLAPLSRASNTPGREASLQRPGQGRPQLVERAAPARPPRWRWPPGACRRRPPTSSDSAHTCAAGLRPAPPRPRAPSVPMPVSTTAVPGAHHAAPALSKSRSTEGAWRSSGRGARAPSSVHSALALGRPRAARRRARCRRGRPARRSPCFASRTSKGQGLIEPLGEGRGEARRHVLRHQHRHRQVPPRASSSFCTAGGPPVDAPTRRAPAAPRPEAPSSSPARAARARAATAAALLAAHEAGARAPSPPARAARAPARRGRPSLGLAMKSKAPSCSALKTSDGCPYDGQHDHRRGRRGHQQPQEGEAVEPAASPGRA